MSNASTADRDEWRRAFGARVVELRTERGLSQLRLAELAAMQPTYLSDIEQGRRNPGLVNIHVIARALGVHVADLFPRK